MGKSKHSLVAKHVTAEKWAKLGGLKTKTSGFTLGQAIACAVQFDDQHCGIYAGDGDSYKDFAEVFDPIIEEYHGLPKGFKHTSDMYADKIKGNVDSRAPVHSARLRVGRSIDGFGLSPGITKAQRLAMEDLMKSAFAKLSGDLAGKYYPLLAWLNPTDNNWSMIISFSSPATRTWSPLAWRGIGLKVAVFSTTLPRLSLSGSMKKISLGSSLFKKVVMSEVFSKGWLVVSRLLVTLSKPNLAKNSCWTKSWATCTPAPPTWAPA